MELMRANQGVAVGIYAIVSKSSCFCLYPDHEATSEKLQHIELLF